MHLRPLLFLPVLLASLPAAERPPYRPDANAPRSAVPDEYKWDLAPLYPSDAAFAQARTQLLGELGTLRPFAGRLADPAALARCLDRYFQLHRTANFLTLYATLRQKTAQSDDAASALNQQALAAMDEVMRASAFIRRELLMLPQAPPAQALREQPGLAPHRAYIENLRRRASRILSPDAERALGLLGDNLWAEIDLNELPSGFEEVRSALLASLRWPSVPDAAGQPVELNLSNYPHFRSSPNRAVRRAAVAALMSTLRTHQHALAGTLAGQVRLDVAYAKARGYDTALAAYLDKDNVAPVVYENLVHTVNANLGLLHRYVALRRKLLGVDTVHLYDLYVPLVPGVAKEVPFAEARRLLPEALAPLGRDYGEALREGLDPRNGWLDVYPHRDKDSGASCSSGYGPHPWLQLNYQDSLDDLSTLAHEFGHALHSHLAMRAQSYPDFRFPPLLAEVASTCNEAILSDFLVARATDPKEKAHLLVARLETMRTTIFRQTLFAEFERAIHEAAEEGTPVTAALLDSTYAGLVRRYYGPAYRLDPDDGMEWAYIEHFFYKYYVYTYATGLSCGIALADRVREQGEPGVQAYLGLLRGGLSRPPLDLLRQAGIDLTTPAPVEAAMRSFQRTLDEVEALLAQP